MIVPVFMYGLSSVGLSEKSSFLLRKEIMRCLRRIAKSPAHITLESDARLLARLGILHPKQRAQVSSCQLVRRMLITLSSEVCPCSQLQQMVETHSTLKSPWWTTLIEGLSLLFPKYVHVDYLSLSSFLIRADKKLFSLSNLASGKTTSHTSTLPDQELGCHVCEGCGRRFPSHNQLRSHQYGSKLCLET